VCTCDDPKTALLYRAWSLELHGCSNRTNCTDIMGHWHSVTFVFNQLSTSERFVLSDAVFVVSADHQCAPAVGPRWLLVVSDVYGSSGLHGPGPGPTGYHICWGSGRVQMIAIKRCIEHFGLSRVIFFAKKNVFAIARNLCSWHSQNIERSGATCTLSNWLAITWAFTRNPRLVSEGK
jgi:hypothetical protein